MVAPSVSPSRKRQFNDSPQKGMFEQFLGIWGLDILRSQAGEDGKISKLNFLAQESMVESF